MNLVPLGEVGSQCCGHVQALACDYCHVVYLVERKGWSSFVSSHAIVRDTGAVHCSVSNAQFGSVSHLYRLLMFV